MRRLKVRTPAEHVLVEPKSFEELVVQSQQGAAKTPNTPWYRCLRYHYHDTGWLVSSVLSTVGTLVGFGMIISAVPGPVSTSFTAGTFVLAVASVLVFRRKSMNLHSEPATCSAPSIARPIAAYLGKLIAEEQRRCIGEDSDIEQLRKRTDEVLDRARSLKERLSGRIVEERHRSNGDGTIPAYLTAAHERAGLVVERIQRSSEQLSQHRAKLDAFFAECRARVQAAEKPLQDLELVAAVESLDEEGQRLGTEVQEVIVHSTGELFGRLQQLRSTLGLSLAHAGVHLALATPTSSNVERDARILEDTIARFRPPRIVADDHAAAPAAQRTSIPA